MPKVIHRITKLISGRVTAFQGDSQTNRIWGKEKSAGPALLILGIAFVSLLYISTTHAESSPDSLTITAEKSLTVTVPNTTNLSIHPTDNGSFNTANIDIIVNTNNRYGYNLNMTTATTTLTGNAPLSGGNYPVIDTISSSGMTCTVDTGSTCNFTKDKWGYKLSSDTTYSPIQANTNILIKNNTNESTGTPETNTITFGARLSNATPAGSYSTTLSFIATINNPTVVGGVSFEEAFDFVGKQKYNGYYAMQDMDATICSYVRTSAESDYRDTEEVQLIDKRDGKLYWVAKLLDDNCWMTQNLDLNLDSSVALTSADTDLNSVSSWIPVRSTIDSTSYNNTASGASGGILSYGGRVENTGFTPSCTATITTNCWTNDENTPYSADPGYRYVVPKEMTGPNTEWYDNSDIYYYCATNDTTCGGNSENGHYTMGNFYNFAAATATNNVEITLGGSTNLAQNAKMPNSICPKGWRLPIGQTTNNEFKKLLGGSGYDITSSPGYESLNAIRITPLYFVRSGLVDDGTLSVAGARGRVWSNTISDADNVYDLNFLSQGIHTASLGRIYSGFSVRCLVRTE